MKVVIAEKPSVARDIANVLGASKRNDGYFSGGDYAVTWALGHTAKDTLAIAQALYETHKLLTYPRTESRHLSTKMIDSLPEILEAVPTRFDPARSQALRRAAVGSPLSKAYVDDSKLTDHHAIIPTARRAPEGLPARERNLYELAVVRFLGIFLQNAVRSDTVALLRLGKHTFRATGSVMKEPGWTVLKTREPQKKEQESEEEPDQSLPVLEEGQIVAKTGSAVVEKKRGPPRAYTDASLLAAMKNAGRLVTDETLAAYMKHNGLGTAATRGNHRAIDSKPISGTSEKDAPSDSERNGAYCSSPPWIERSSDDGGLGAETEADRGCRIRCRFIRTERWAVYETRTPSGHDVPRRPHAPGVSTAHRGPLPLRPDCKRSLAWNLDLVARLRSPPAGITEPCANQPSDRGVDDFAAGSRSAAREGSRLMFRWLMGLWKRREREIDLAILWPACKRYPRSRQADRRGKGRGPLKPRVRNSTAPHHNNTCYA